MQFNLLNLGASLCSPSGKNAKLSILIYHRVLPKQDPIFYDEVTAEIFDWQMSLLSRHFVVLPLSEAIERLTQNSLPARSACITFDDGYADNAEIALPILQRHALPATFFIASGFLDGGRMWNDTVIESIKLAQGPILDLGQIGLERYPVGDDKQRRSTIFLLLKALKYLPQAQRDAQVQKISEVVDGTLPENLMMTSEQLKTLHSAGMEIGGHTVTHPILARLNPETAQSEMAEGRQFLQELLRVPINLFAYPNGKPKEDYQAEHVAMAKSIGFKAAVSTAWGTASAASDYFQLPRFTPWDKTPTRFAMRLLKNCLQRKEAVVA